MAKIIPFKAFRPPKNMVHLVASRSFVSYSKSGLKHKLNTNPYSFINIINPEFGLKKRTKPNSLNRFKKVRNKYDDFIKKGVFVEDESESLYIYRQKIQGNCYTGIIGGASIKDYENGTIKKHELTLKKREEVFKNYLKITDINAEPVLMTYPDNKTIEQVINHFIETSSPEYNFMTANGASHELWLVSKQKDIKIIQEEFKNFNALYIADGHHRFASSYLLSKEFQKKNNTKITSNKQNYLMGFFIPESKLNILEFSRIVSDLNGLTDNEFLAQLKLAFNIHIQEKGYHSPKSIEQIGMYLSNKWYTLEPKPSSIDTNNCVDELSVSVLSNSILAKILNIKDIRTDNRVTFIGGRKQHKEIEKLVDAKKMKVGFSLHPLTIEQLKNVADQKLCMPPKSTYIEPKLRSGLLLYKISNS